MPWKESDTVSERMKFVSRILEGERMTDVCREYGISRKTGYKIFARYEREGVSGLEASAFNMAYTCHQYDPRDFGSAPADKENQTTW